MPRISIVQPSDIHKAETYTPTSGMKSAARRALRWKEEGKAKGAGTPVGWGRATDIVAGRGLSLDTVKRMYSFFSRHEVDKKGKDFYNTSNPSNGRIMWDAWGGDAGFSWSRAIVEREKRKAEKAWEGTAFITKRGQAVEDLGIEEVKQLVNFYRQKASDLEFQLLQSQLKMNKLLLQKSEPVPATKITKSKSEQ